MASVMLNGWKIFSWLWNSMVTPTLLTPPNPGSGHFFNEVPVLKFLNRRPDVMRTVKAEIDKISAKSIIFLYFLGNKFFSRAIKKCYSNQI